MTPFLAPQESALSQCHEEDTWGEAAGTSQLLPLTSPAHNFRFEIIAFRFLGLRFMVTHVDVWQPCSIFQEPSFSCWFPPLPLGRPFLREAGERRGVDVK